MERQPPIIQWAADTIRLAEIAYREADPSMRDAVLDRVAQKFGAEFAEDFYVTAGVFFADRLWHELDTEYGS